MTFEAVHKAIKRGDVEVLRSALKGGLDPDLANRNGWTILMLTACRGDSKIGELLVESGADVDRRNNFRETALSLAALTGHSSFVELP